MAKQVGPQERKPELLPVLRARHGDEGVLGEFHQGPQIYSVCNKAGYKTAADFSYRKNTKYLLPNRERPYKSIMKWTRIAGQQNAEVKELFSV